VFQDIERSACGCDYGGTSWTTREEADRICVLLGLIPGRRLLEVGSGSGWPGLYMAQQTGCDLAMVDLPLSALRLAAKRNSEDGLEGHCSFVVADAGSIPFRDREFDAISHSDVLCCLDRKSDVLTDCGRVLDRDGAMVFTVISITPGLSATDLKRAIEFGPPFVKSETDYSTMLTGSGWRVRDREDLTSGFLSTARNYLKGLEARQDELVALLGAAECDEDLSRMRAKVDAIENGLLRRELYAAVPAG